MSEILRAPFPYFGGKRTIAPEVWARFGHVKQYIEPFCGSCAVLLAAPKPATLEVVCDINGFIANFWRSVKYQPNAVAEWADYPVSHIDLGARHGWLMEQRDRLGSEMQDPEWPGDAQIAGWWLWGQCAWIGGGWCAWDGSKIPHVSDGGQGVQAVGKIPHVSDGGRGVQAVGGIPHVSDGGQGVQAVGKIPHVSSGGRGEFLTSSGRVAWQWLRAISDRLERVRVIHGAWTRCLNHHYGGENTAVFLDPPYGGYESVYSEKCSVAKEVGEWAIAHPELKIALCGHEGDYSADGWECMPWKRKGLTYRGGKTTDKERIWFSPACERVEELVH